MEFTEIPQDVSRSYCLSWTAYVRPVLLLLAAWVFGAFCYRFGHWAAIGIWLVSLIWFALAAATLHSVVLYTNDAGVWVYRGIFPWSKGASGVRWRDIEIAEFYTGFKSWLFKSYSLSVHNRFSQQAEIMLGHVAQGHIAVQQINEDLARAIARGVADR